MKKTNRVIKVAFKKGMSPISGVIRAITNSRYSHTEIVIGDSWYGANIDLIHGSKVTKRVKPEIDEEDWDIWDIEVTKEQYKKIKEDIEKFVGRGYSFSNLVGWMIDYNVSGGEEFICSEFVAYILKKNKVLKLHKIPISYDPGTLFNELNVKFRYTAKDKLKVMKGKLSKLNISKEELYLEW